MVNEDTQGEGGEDGMSIADIEKNHDELSDLVENGTVDCKGLPANKTRTGRWTAAPLIFGAETCERLCAFGVTYNLVTYLVGNLYLSQTYAANMVTNIAGTALLTSLIGGFVADSWLGRYWTIGLSGTIQFSGLLLLTLTATLPAFRLPPCSPPQIMCTPVHGTKLAVLYVAMYLIALGTGGIKSCVSAFGANQFDQNDPLEKEHSMYFFNWFFGCITTGSLLAVTLSVWMQEQYGRGTGFGFTCVAVLVATISFLSGRRVYRYSLPSGSPLSAIAKVVRAAFDNRKLDRPADPSMLYELHESDLEFYRDYDIIGHTPQFRFLDKAAIILPNDAKLNPEGERILAKATVTQVEEVKMLIRVLPILGTVCVFWTVYAQMTTFTIEQSELMNRKLSSHFSFPPASINVFLHGGIVITIGFYGKVLGPFLSKHVTGKEQGLTFLQRIGVGLVLSILAMVSAALVESKRLKSVHANDSPISAFWLVPQTLFVGLGEGFTYSAELEFFYSQSPKKMRSLGASFCLVTLALGFYFSTLLVNAVNSVTPHWLGISLNSSRLDLFYWVLGIITCLNFLLYLLVASWYKYAAYGNPPSQDKEYSANGNSLSQDKDAVPSSPPHSS